MTRLLAFTTVALAMGLTPALAATPLTVGIPSQEFSPIEKIGCARAGDNCPYGQRIVRGGGGWWCEPCWRHGHGHGNWSGNYDRDYEPRHYRDYGDWDEPRRYRDY